MQWWLLAGLALHGETAATGTYSVTTGRHTSFIIEDGAASAIGWNAFGQLGVASDDREVIELTPIHFDIADEGAMQNVSIRDISAGAFHSVLLLEASNVTEGQLLFATGRNNFGQLGDGGAVNLSTAFQAVAVPPGAHGAPREVVAIATGYAHSVVLDSDGGVWSWGLNAAGQLGDGTTASRNVPTRVAFGEDPARAIARAIAAGYDFTYILSESGQVWACGQNLGGQLGVGDRLRRLSPIAGLSGVAQLAAGESHGLFTMEDGRMLGTGSNFAGQLGDGSSESRWETFSSYAGPVRRVAAAGDGGCLAPEEDGGPLCFGSNLDGQLGQATILVVFEPTPVPAVRYADVLAPGERHSLFLSHDQVLGAGSNRFGALGGDFNASTGEPQVVASFDRGIRTTPAPSPAPSTPAPPPVPTLAPSPQTTRQGTADGLPDVPFFRLMGGLCIGILVCLCLLQTGREAEAARRRSIASRASAAAADLELSERGRD